MAKSIDFDLKFNSNGEQVIGKFTVSAKYPCFQTLGANFDFKDVTGKEVSKIDPESITELAAYMWATIKGACTRQGIEFPYQTPRELAYHLDENSIVEWSAMMEANESKKK